MKESTPFVQVLKHSGGRKFADMTGTQKLVFIGKLIVCIATFGFAFPNVQHD
jgi:hypothetical protein